MIDVLEVTDTECSKLISHMIGRLTFICSIWIFFVGEDALLWKGFGSNTPNNHTKNNLLDPDRPPKF